MSQYQSHIIPEDNALKHLDTALNTEKMKAVFQQQLYADRSVLIEACQIERIKYKPQKNCHISYRLRFKKNQRHKKTEQLVCARFYQQAGSLSRFLKEEDIDKAQNSLVHIPELDCVTWVFPCDRKLGQLERITDANFLYRQVALGLVAKVYGRGWTIKEFSSEMIRYVPEQNCTVRIQLNVEHDSIAPHKSLVAYGKACYNQSGKQVYQLMEQLWKSKSCSKNKLRIPQPLMYQPQFKMYWQMGVPGMMLSELAENETLFLGCMSKVAEQIALLHQIPLQDCRYRKQHDLRQELDKVRLLMGKFNAPCRGRINTIIAKLNSLAPSVQSESLATLHGDLHLKNILVDKGQVYLIDLDSLSIGNPLLDIGSFIAAIINLGLIGSLSLPLAEQTILLLLQNYTKKVPWSVNYDDLRWYIVVALVTERIFRGFTRLKAGRMEVIEDLVKQAEMILDQSYTPNWLQITG